MEAKFIPYQLALIAYEKGFKIQNYGIGWYYKRRSTGEIHGLDTFYIDTNQNIEQWNSLEEPVEAIIYQQIIDWLREKHSIVVFVDYTFINEDSKCWNRGHATGFVYRFKNKSFGAEYYEAFNKAIEEAFKLI